MLDSQETRHRLFQPSHKLHYKIKSSSLMVFLNVLNVEKGDFITLVPLLTL